MAITTKGVLDWILYEKAGSDHCRLIEFIKQLIEGKKKKLILMDNASCHRNENVKDFIIKSKNDFLYILPYHHYLNPIEEYFNQLKYYIKLDKPLEYEDIKRSIKKSINNIKINNYNNYFLHSFDIKYLIKPKKISTKRKKLKKYI